MIKYQAVNELDFIKIFRVSVKTSRSPEEYLLLVQSLSHVSRMINGPTSKDLFT